MSDYLIEKLAYDLAEEFRNNYKKYSFRIFSMKNVKNSKWWIYFYKTAQKYINEENFNPKYFVKLQFDNHGKILPFFLPGKNAEKTYRDNFYQEDSQEKQILKDIENSKNAIILWARKHKKDFNEYFNVNDVLLKQRVDYLSTTYLSFSKSFLNRYAKIPDKKKNEYVVKKDLNLKRSLAKQYRLFNDIKEIMGDDFI